MPAVLQDGGEVALAEPPKSLQDGGEVTPAPPEPLQTGGEVKPTAPEVKPTAPTEPVVKPPPPPTEPAKPKPSLLTALTADQQKKLENLKPAIVQPVTPLQEGGEVGPLQAGGEVVEPVRPADNQQDQFVQAAKYAAAHPDDVEGRKKLVDSIMQTTKTGPSTDEYTGRLVQGLGDAWNNLPALGGQLQHFGVTAAQAALVRAKLASGQPMTPQDYVVLHTFYAGAQEGDTHFEELGENLRNWAAKNDPTGAIRALSGAFGDPNDPNQLSWDQINRLPEDQKRAIINGKVDFQANRFKQAEERAKGELVVPFWKEELELATGYHASTIDAMAQHGLHPDPQAIAGGGFVLDPTNIMLPGVDSVIGPLAKLVTGGLERTVTGAIVEAGGRALEETLGKPGVLETIAPQIGKKLGGAAVSMPLRGLGLTKIPFPLNLAADPVVKAMISPLVKGGQAVGERLGGIPQLLREKVWEPMAEMTQQMGQDIRTGGSGFEARYGPLAQLFGGVAGGAVKGGVAAVPFALGAETPEEAGQTIGGGMQLGAAMHVIPAGIDAAMNNVFFRGGRSDTVNYGKIDYGTQYGQAGNQFGLDQPHNSFTSTLDPQEQQRINNLRAWFPGIELYVTDHGDYQGAVQKLQNAKILDPAQNNLKTRGLNVADPGTGKPIVLVDGEAKYRRGDIFDTIHHEIGHSIYRTMSDPDKQAFKNAGANRFDMNDFTRRYARRVSGVDGIKYTDLPTEAEINSGAKQFLPNLDGITQETMNEELGAETVAQLLHGEPLENFQKDPTRLRSLQMGFGRVLNKLGMEVTPEKATTILGVRPGMDRIFLMDKVLRDYVQANKPSAAGGPPAGVGGGPTPTGGKGGLQKTAPTPPPTGGHAPGPPPTPTGGPAKVTNNQPEIGGGSTGAPPEEIEKAVTTIQNEYKISRREAQEAVNNSSGQTAGELVLHIYQERQRRLANPEVIDLRKPVAPRRQAAPEAAPELKTPQEAKAAEAPVFPAPNVRHRLMPTDELTRRATLGDPQAVQTLIERHGANWLEDAEKADPQAAKLYRSKNPEDAAAQDQRIKAQAQAEESAKARAKEEGRPEPKPVDAARIQELRQQAEREIPRAGYMPPEEEEYEGPRTFRNAAEHEAAIHARHLHLVMGEHNNMLDPQDTRVRLRVDPDSGRRTYYGTHFDPSDPVHNWLLSQMDPMERDFMARAQAAIAAGVPMNFNYTHAPRMGRKWIPSGPERELEYEASEAKARAAGESTGQVGNRTFLPQSIGVGADGQGLTYGMATDKVLGNIVKADRAMRGKTPYGHITKANLPNLIDDMRKVGENHRAGWRGDGSAPLVGTVSRPVNVNPSYTPQPIPDAHAQFINMIMNARDPLMYARVGKKGGLTQAGKAVEFAEANKGYTFPFLSHGQERTEVNPMRQALEKKGVFKGRDLEHGYEQFRADLMRPTNDPAPAIRKHGFKSFDVMGGPERRFAAAGFMPVEEGAVSPEEFIRQRDQSTRPGFLTPITPADLQNHRLFTIHGGKVGAALSPEGDIQNVYNNGGPKGDAAYVLAHAINQGGRTLDCYDDYLPKLYRQFGMKETGRMTFNPDFAPAGWDHVKDDSPDVVFMGWDGYPEGSPERAVARAKGKKDDWIRNERAGQREEDWDAAKGRSQAFARGEDVPGVAPTSVRPQAVGAGEAPRPGAGEAGRRPVVGYMPLAGPEAQMYPEEEAAGRTFVSHLPGRTKQFEIDDRDMTWVAAPKGSTEKTMVEHNFGRGDGTSMLGQVINHPDLFKNYPDLRRIVVEGNPLMRGSGSWEPRLSGSEPERITLRTLDKGVLAHEIQHAVQYRENWPGGASPRRMLDELQDDPAIEADLRNTYSARWPELGPTEFPDKQSYFDYIADRHEHYNRWRANRLVRMANSAYLGRPGEVEARAVGQRAKQPPGWRLPPEEHVAAEQKATEEKAAQLREQMAAGDLLAKGPMTPGSKVGYMPPEAPEGAAKNLPQEPEWIKAAAFRGYDKTIHTGTTHAEIINRLEEENKPTEFEDTGFVTNRGRYVGRDEAAQISKRAGQGEPRFDPGHGLHSFDIQPRVGFMPPEEEEAPPTKGKKVAAQKIVAPKELRDEFITPQEQAVLDRLTEDSKRVLNKYKEGPLNVASESLGERALPPGVKYVEQVGEHFSDKNPTLDFNNEDHREHMATSLVHDILRRIISHPDSYGWYNRNVNASMKEVGKLNPKIASDPVHNLVFRLCLAVTSQDQKVHPNFESAYRAYLHWDRTGKFPEAEGKNYFGGGTKGGVMEQNFAKLNKLWDMYGGPEKLEEQLKQRMTIRDIDKVFGTNIAEPKDYTTEFSAILGPKIGSFFNNLSGIFNTLTSDVWMTRTFNRLAGKMMAFSPSVLFRNPDPKTTPYLTALRNAIADGSMENATTKQQKAMLREADALDQYKDNPDALDRKTAMQIAPTIRDWASEQHGRFAANTPDPTGKVRSYWDKRPINYLAKNIDNNFSNLEGGPRNPSEREAFRDIMERAINKLAAEGINITPADAQAVVWYMEQDLFSMARYGRPGEGSFDYLDAAYALRQKYQGKTPNQFGEVPGAEAPSVPKKKAGKAGKMPEGLPEPVPMERGPPTLAPPVTQAEKEEAERRKQLPVAEAEAPPPAPEERQARPPNGGWTPTLPPPSVVAATQGPLSQPQSAEPGIDIQSRSYTRGRTVKPQWIVLHSTDATEDSSINTLTQGGKSVHYLSTRDGRLLHFVPEADTAFHAGRDKFGKDGNPGSIGFEQVHNDDLNEPWDDAEVRATARGVAGAMQRWGIPLNHVIGHGDLAPGRKVDPKGYPWGKFYGYVREALGQGGAPPATTTKAVATVSQPDQETRRRTGSASAAHIMREEGSGGVQDGIKEIFGFREGEDSEYPTLARLRASGDEEGVARVASQGFVQRAIDAGSQQFSDPRIKAQIMSLAHMRGPSGARAILNAVGTGRLANSGRADGLDPEAVRAINEMGTEEFLRRVQIARTKYDQIVHGQDYWTRFGRGLESRYARERQFYGSLS